MTKSDQAEFFSIIVAAAEITGRSVSSKALQLYWHALKRYDLESIKAAVESHCLDSDVGQFLPTPAHIVRQIDGSSDEKAALAWGKVETGLRQAGAWHSVAFDDPRIHVVIHDMGGWHSFCVLNNFDLPARRKEFIARYRRYFNHAVLPAHPLFFQGKGNSEEIPRLIGDKAEAARVVSGHYLGAPQRPLMLTSNEGKVR